MSTRMVLGLVGLVCSLVVMLQGSADYPAKPVRIIEPFGAGGGPDIIARAISPKLTALWGQPVTVENHPVIVLSGDNLGGPVLGTEKNSMVLPRRIQLEDAQCRPVETGSQLGHGDRKN